MRRISIKLTITLVLTALTINSVEAAAPGARRGDARLAKMQHDTGRHERRADRRGERRDGHHQERRHDRREHRWEDRRDDRWERHVKFRVGMRLLTLPARHLAVTVGTTTYFYADGVYLIEQPGGYVVVSAPIGARVAVLPYGFRALTVGPRRYFVHGATYYVFDPAVRAYVVVARPAEADSLPPSTPAPVIYPAAGQSEAQLAEDRYQCHTWALEETNFDPLAHGAAATAGQDAYNRALGTCMTARSYSVG